MILGNLSSSLYYCKFLGFNNLIHLTGYNFSKETLPYHLKNTNQKAAALDEVNRLINGVTDLSYLDDQMYAEIEARNTPDKESSQSTNIYG